MNTVTIIGWHGMQNAGDDAFCHVLVDWAIQKLGAAKVNVWSVPSKLPGIHRLSHIPVLGVLPEVRVGRWHRYFLEPRLMFGSDIVIFGGGTIFQQRRWWWLWWQMVLLRMLRWLRISKTRVAAVGISLGPFRTEKDKRGCERVLRWFDAILVRDVASLKLAHQMRLTSAVGACDLAIALTDVVPTATHILASRTVNSGTSNSSIQSVVASHETPVLGVSLVDRDRELGREEVDNLKQVALVEAIRLLHEKTPSLRVKLFVFCEDSQRGDWEATERFRKALAEVGIGGQIVRYHSTLENLLAEIATVDVMLCNRMHAYVFSCLTQTPAIALAYAPKMIDFVVSMNGSREDLFEIQDLDPDRLADRIRHLLVEPRTPCPPAFLDSARQQLHRQLAHVAKSLGYHDLR